MSSMLGRSRTTILMSVNTTVVFIALIIFVSVFIFKGGFNFRVVGERSDIIEDKDNEIALIESAIDNAKDNAANSEIIPYNGEAGGYTFTTQPDYGLSDSAVPDGEIWSEKSMTIYATPDIDICVGGGLKNLGDTYWQTSDTDVIAGFYSSARTWLGYNSDTCRYPVIAGVGTTTITVGTYDGKRKDSIKVTVVEPPVEQWKREVLSFVNNIRANNNLAPLEWGVTCEGAADIRAEEIKILYEHTRPDGSDWSTACPLPASGGTSGENLAIGNAAVSPVTTVMLWMGSDSHRENILNPTYTNLAVGFNFDLNTRYKTHWSQYFSTY